MLNIFERVISILGSLGGFGSFVIAIIMYKNGNLKFEFTMEETYRFLGSTLTIVMVALLHLSNRIRIRRLEAENKKIKLASSEIALSCMEAIHNNPGLLPEKDAGRFHNRLNKACNSIGVQIDMSKLDQNGNPIK